jgi:RHS repeat-associated protein
VDKTGSSYQGNYFLKDHLGSIRTTLKGWESVVTDDFSGTLSQWSTVQGSGFAISSGTVTCSYPSQSILVSNTGKSLLNGSYTADVKSSSSGPVDMGLVFRYQNTSNYYWLSITGSSMILKKRSGGSNSTLATYGSGASSGVFNRFRLDLSTSGSTLTIKVYYNGVYKFSATDNSPLAAGSVGMIGGYSTVSWDNAVATTNTTPGTVVSYDDLDAWGMVLEGRSGNTADGRQRFKFTGKERDAESKYDYFGARYYDGRICRFLSVDRIESRSRNRSVYSIAANCPLLWVEVNGDSLGVPTFGSYLSRLEQAEGKNKLVKGDPFSGAVQTVKAILTKCEDLTGFKLPGVAKEVIAGGIVPSGVGLPSKMKLVGEVGAAGEEAAGIIKNTTRIESMSGTAKYRIPDELTATSLTEVKNVARQGMTSQIVDFLAYSENTGRNFTLVVRPSTVLSSAVQDAVKAGRITLETLK